MCWKSKSHGLSCNLWNYLHDVVSFGYGVIFMHHLMSDHLTISDVDCHRWAQCYMSFDFSICWAESVLSSLAGWWLWNVWWWIHDFDGESVKLTKIYGYHTSKVRFSKSYISKGRKMRKRTQKMGFRWNLANLDLHGRRLPCTYGLLRPWGASVPVSAAFLTFFLFGMFLLIYSDTFWYAFLVVKSMESHPKWGVKFSSLRESQRLCRAKVLICHQKSKLVQTMSEWHVIWGGASWA